MWGGRAVSADAGGKGFWRVSTGRCRLPTSEVLSDLPVGHKDHFEPLLPPRTSSAASGNARQYHGVTTSLHRRQPFHSWSINYPPFAPRRSWLPNHARRSNLPIMSDTSADAPPGQASVERLLPGLQQLRV